MIADRSIHDVRLHLGSGSAVHAGEWARALATWLHRTWCALRGHGLVLHFEPHRMFLQCVDCGWASSGWTINGTRLSHAHEAIVRANVTSHVEQRRVQLRG